MLSLFHLAQKSCLAGKLFLTHLPSLPSLPIWRFLNLKLAWSLQKLQRLLFFKPYSLFSLACPWKLKCSKSLFVKCTYCMVVSRLIPFEFLLLKSYHWVLFIQLKIPEFSDRNRMERTISLRSDRNIWEHLWRWSTLTGLVISFGRSDRNVPFHLTKLLSPVPLFWILLTRTITKRAVAWVGSV